MPRLATGRQALHASAAAVIAAALATACLCAGTAAAQPHEAGGPDGPRRGPPPEALAACKSMAAGKACSVTLGSNKLNGTCWAPEGKPLACRPSGAPAPDGSKPVESNK
jgi:hypothetical protein